MFMPSSTMSSSSGFSVFANLSTRMFNMARFLGKVFFGFLNFCKDCNIVRRLSIGVSISFGGHLIWFSSKKLWNWYFHVRAWGMRPCDWSKTSDKKGIAFLMDGQSEVLKPSVILVNAKSFAGAMRRASMCVRKRFNEAASVRS